MTIRDNWSNAQAVGDAFISLRKQFGAFKEALEEIGDPKKAGLPSYKVINTSEDNVTCTFAGREFQFQFHVETDPTGVKGITTLWIRDLINVDKWYVKNRLTFECDGRTSVSADSNRVLYLSSPKGIAALCLLWLSEALSREP